MLTYLCKRNFGGPLSSARARRQLIGDGKKVKVKNKLNHMYGKLSKSEESFNS